MKASLRSKIQQWGNWTAQTHPENSPRPLLRAPSRGAAKTGAGLGQSKDHRRVRGEPTDAAARLSSAVHAVIEEEEAREFTLGTKALRSRQNKISAASSSWFPLH